ncbi:MAG: glycosyltransferase [Chamaesiphon sp.]|nr:glycosyltransferase [Chamaesiphon sp.]
MLDTAAPDKNPQGFILLASIVNQQYPGKAKFIRAGRDRDVNVDYDKESIVRFPGYMPDRAKNYLFGLTHFIVVPYLFSTQSGVVTEALSHGKLIIVNDIPAFTHLKGLDFVFAIDFNDEDAIVNCLKDLFNLD